MNEIKMFINRKRVLIKENELGFYTYNDYLIDPVNKKFVHISISSKFDGKIKKDYQVHHCDFNKRNNSIDNLVQIPISFHKHIHANNIRVSKSEILNNLLPNYKKTTANHKDTNLITSQLSILVKQLINHPEKDKIIRKIKNQTKISLLLR